MIELEELLKDLDYKSNCNLNGILVQNIKCDSRTVNKEDLFVAIKGTAYDGHDFIDEAIEKGAALIVSFVNFRHPDSKVPLISVPDTRKALAILAKNFYQNPSGNINIIGITGTNGKTTVSFLLESILAVAGRGVGRIGTIDHRIEDKVIEAVNTTPSSLLLNQFLREMVDRSLDYAVMEVSSHSLAQHRTDGVLFDTAVFTNISAEHLDYHRSFQQYVNAKKRLFSGLNPDAGAVLNVEDPRFEDIRRAVSSKRILGFGIERDADIKARDLRMDIGGSEFVMDAKGDSTLINTSLIGRFNVSNILAAASAALMEGISLDSIKKGIESLKGIPGRLQLIKSKRNFMVFIDYAHTDDALKNVLETLTAISKNRLIIVFGCGGQRDRSKRPRMGRVAASLADYVIITSDNQRNEDPELIAEEVKQGLKKGFKDYEVILDRRKAIKRAISLAGDGDIVLIAGKGHEKYQIIEEKKIPFSDEEVVKEILGK